MGQSVVDKHVGQQAPSVTVQRQRSEISPAGDQRLYRRGPPRGPTGHHGDIDQPVQDDEQRDDEKARCGDLQGLLKIREAVFRAYGLRVFG